MSIWEIDGRIVIGDDGAPIECDTCPCDEELPDCQPCEDCDLATTARTVTIVVTGIVDDSCGDCSDFNDTYVLEKNDDVDPCSWGLSFENDCFPGEQCDWILIPGGLGSPWELVLTISNNPDGGTWLSFGGGDCSEDDTASNFNSVGTKCDFSSSSVEIQPDAEDLCNPGNVSCGFCGDCGDEAPVLFDLFFDGLVNADEPEIGCGDGDNCMDFNDIKFTVIKTSETAFACRWFLGLEFGWPDVPCLTEEDEFGWNAHFRIETDFMGGLGFFASTGFGSGHWQFVGASATENCCFESLTLTTLVVNDPDYCDASAASVTIKPSTEKSPGVYPR